MTPSSSGPPDVARRRQRTPMPIERVRQWIAASLVFTTLEHLAGGMILGAVLMEAGRESSRIGLIVMSGIWGLVAVLAARLILQERLLTPWLLLAFVWPLVGVYVLYWR